jgi:hypothetical protein
MSDLTGVSIRDCRPEEVVAVLELWRQADATPGVTDNADDCPASRYRKPGQRAGGRGRGADRRLHHLFVVLYEEPTLKRQFGASYESYYKSVPRWIPRRGSFSRLHRGQSAAPAFPHEDLKNLWPLQSEAETKS